MIWLNVKIVIRKWKPTIPEQFNLGYRHGTADARIVEENMKVNRYISINNLSHKHDDFIKGYCYGFIGQKEKMDISDLEEDAKNGVKEYE